MAQKKIHDPNRIHQSLLNGWSYAFQMIPSSKLTHYLLQSIIIRQLNFLCNCDSEVGKKESPVLTLLTLTSGR